METREIVKQLREALEWKPIETAPRTGEHILAANFNSIGFYGPGKAFHDVVHWWSNPGEEGWYPSFGPDETVNGLTHWKPLHDLVPQLLDGLESAERSGEIDYEKDAKNLAIIVKRLLYTMATNGLSEKQSFGDAVDFMESRGYISPTDILRVTD